ncbi:MAG: hypothetical protein J1E43_01635 [Christensenellaceae bacterium]|nr:hypothetical protein [Christensenellaceae bacterium]
MRRFLSLLLCMMMVFACVSQTLTTALAAGTTGEAMDGYNELHFLVRHWHTVTVDGDKLQSATQRSASAVAIEGYITPNGTGYSIRARRYLGIESQAEYEIITNDNLRGMSEYIESVDLREGKITLKQHPLVEDVESFAGYSVTAGHSATKDVNDGNLTIEYSPSVHLVKSHAFYTASAQSRKGLGAGDKSADSEANWPYEEQDTAWENSTKVYNTAKGLHTDKTASENKNYSDNRTFDIELEAWYSIGKAPYIGMVLDASGSMAFTVGEPKVISIYDKLGKDSDKLKELEAKKLPEDTTDTAVWQDKFLTDEQVAYLLNKYKTDNSRLSSSGYSYYVYDATGAEEYAPLGYWDGTVESDEDDIPVWIGQYTFTSGSRAVNSRTLERDALQVVRAEDGKAYEFVGSEVVTSGSGPDRTITFTNRVDVRSGDPEAAAFNVTGSSGGLLLGAKPTGNSVTVTFDVIRNASENKPTITLEPELLYMGPLSSVGASYYRSVRRGTGSINRFAGYQSTMNADTGIPSLGSAVTNVNNVFNGNGNYAKHTIVLSYDGDSNTLTTYMGDSIAGATVAVNDTQNQNPNSPNDGASLELTKGDINIILGGFAFRDVTNEKYPAPPTYGGAPILIDNVNVFDAALTPAEIVKIMEDAAPIDASEQFVAKSDESDDATNLGTIERRYLTVKNGALQGVAGWYFINPVNNWNANYNNPDIETAKTLNGTPSQYGTMQRGYPNDVALPGKTEKVAGDDQSMYTPATGVDTPVRFYIDSEGNLRCFFASAIDQKEADQNAELGCSYVYERQDNSYTKTEALQRAIGAFVTRLSETSPTSKVSAVRFSSSHDTLINNQDQLRKLLLLKWTNETYNSLRAMALQYGDGGTQAHSDDNEYNYGLTGSTATWTGLWAFNDMLASKDEKGQAFDPETPKYLIVFTDGLDTDVSGNTAYVNEAKTIASNLRKQGYTIFAVLLDGGPVVDGTDQYARAWDFLASLASKEEYVFVSIDATNEFEKVNDLVDMFTNEILNKNIINPLPDYSVKDYIDPRFDLIDAKGNIWHLNAKGQVEVKDPDGAAVETLNQTSAPWHIVLSEANDVETSAKEADLYYDSSNDMYYLLWTKQEIPNCTEDAHKLNVWNARITIRAKEDFIGGRAVLTNGHDANMNYVFYPGEDDKSTGDENVFGASGTGRTIVGNQEPSGDGEVVHPSKGFPRVVVNVPSIVDGADNENVIYMGETAHNAEIIEGIVDDAIKFAKDNGYWTQWYWEYLHRFEANGLGNDSIATLLDKKVVDLDYYYLPDAPGGNKTNSTGSKEFHEKDKLGTLRYTLKSLMGEADNPGTDNEETRNNLTRRMTLSVTFVPDSEAVRESANNNSLIIEKNAKNGIVYKWDSGYKKVVGVELGNPTAKYDAVTHIVSGNVVLQMIVPQAAVTYLQTLMPGQTITYRAALTRTWDERNIKDQIVAYLDAEFKVPEEAVNGQVIVTVTADKIQYAPGYEYVKAYGLPKGTYTLKNVADGTTQSTLFTFSDIVAVTLEDEHQGLFAPQYPNQYGEIVDGQQKPLTDFKATYDAADSTSPQLGTDTAEGMDYIDERYALLQVTILVDAGNLTVSKTVTGNGGETNKDFTFTVTLDDKSVNGKLGEMTFIDGVATFTLKHGESKTANGLPAGVGYEVKESGNEGYISTSTNAKGNVAENTEVAFVNTRNVVGLTVSKTVAGNGGEKDKDFTFTVTLDDKSVNGKLGEMTFIDGVATFTLKHGESKTAAGLPAGVGYEVKESGNEGYVTTSTNAKGNVAENTEAAFVNTRNVVGLTVSKTVAGNGGETDKDFTFTVTLDDKSVNGKLGEMTFIDGVATFTLKHGESKTAAGLPVGVGYEVKESGNEGYVTTSTNASGNVAENTEVAFVNTRNVGGLTVTKTVAGNGGETNKEFSFTVTLSDKSINGAYGRMNFVNGVANFKLKHGDSITAQFLPIGVTYTVKEETPEGYAVTATGATGTINANAMAIAAFTNTRNAGSLTVSKTVKGTAGETNRAFNFTVMLSDTSINGTYGDMTFSNGVASFKLSHGQSKTASGLPAGVRYSVAELEANQDGYTTTAVGEKGDIANAVVSSAIFMNTKDAPEVPQTGDNSRLGLWIGLMIASMLGLCVSFLTGRRKGSNLK